MPLIETVTYPDMLTPYELEEAAEHIRFLNRSTGKVRTGIGSGREDVNVSCKGGTRVELKGVAHNKWIPQLSHNEAFRQWALLHIREELNKRNLKSDEWKIQTTPLSFIKLGSKYEPIVAAKKARQAIHAVNLPGFKGILSHFTQPGMCFANEITDRLKVIACLEKPNMTHSEEITDINTGIDYPTIKKLLQAGEQDAQIVFWGPDEDVETALETIEERCQMAMDGIPRETRKGFEDGTSIFERVLPGADRMYPDTDSAPIPLEEKQINELRKVIPPTIDHRINQLNQWKIPADCHTFLLKKNLVYLIEDIENQLGVAHRTSGTFFGHYLKFLEGQIDVHKDFHYGLMMNLFSFIREEELDINIAKPMLRVLMEHPNMDMISILTSIKFKRRTQETLLAPVDFLFQKFREITKSERPGAVNDWLMGQIRNQALGNISLSELRTMVQHEIK